MVSYPAPRLRATGAAPVTTEKYERYESMATFVALTADDQELIVFSGQPDSIVIHNFVSGGTFTLTDEHGRAGHPILLEGAQVLETHISRRRVLGRLTTGSVGTVAHVVGKWAERAARA